MRLDASAPDFGEEDETERVPIAADPLVQLLEVEAAGAQPSASTSTGDDGHAARKFFNLSAQYARWRDFRADPHGYGLHGIRLEPGEVVRLTQDEVEAHPAWAGFGVGAATAYATSAVRQKTPVETRRGRRR